MKVIVLGGGVVGVASAWYLAAAGHEVTLIERREAPGLETSFANGGQIAAAPVFLADTWALTGAGWTRLHDGASGTFPFSRSRHALVYSAARGGLVLFGGYNNFEQADTWLFGTAWSTLPAAVSCTQPALRKNRRRAYCPGFSRLSVCGLTKMPPPESPVPIRCA